MDAFAFNIESNQETTTTSVFQHLQTRTALTSGDLRDIKKHATVRHGGAKGKYHHHHTLRLGAKLQLALMAGIL